jgi:hypothetical protein
MHAQLVLPFLRVADPRERKKKKKKKKKKKREEKREGRK